MTARKHTRIISLGKPNIVEAIWTKQVRVADLFRDKEGRIFKVIEVKVKMLQIN